MLGVPIDRIEVVHGDTDKVPFGMGTYGSRSLAVGGTAIVQGDRQDHRQGQEDRRPPARGRGRRHRVRRRATSLSPAPTGRKTLAEVVGAAYVPHNFRSTPSSRASTSRPSTIRSTSPSRRHPHRRGRDRPRHRHGRAGSPTPRWTISARSSTRSSSTARSMAASPRASARRCYEKAASTTSSSGQLLSGSYMDYAMPRADNLPKMDIATLSTPCPHNPLGVKGCGEAGAIARRRR
jgi:carbon-monoxide dehydrogenase large subunit